MLARWVCAAALGLLAPLARAQPVLLEEMTSHELRERIDKGMTIVLVPIGGTEQNGPHLALGKHNTRVRELAARIAAELGNAAVAPVLAYAPEGSIEPPSGHMRFAGTISIPMATFEAVLDATARSLCRHGFRHVFFLGDHGGYQGRMQRAAERLDRQAQALHCRVRAVREYYDVTHTAYVELLRKRGYSDREIGNHAGLADTSLSMALDPRSVQPDRFGDAARQGAAAGVEGDPSRSTAELGQLGVQAIVEATLQAIRASLQAPMR